MHNVYNCGNEDSCSPKVTNIQDSVNSFLHELVLLATFFWHCLLVIIVNNMATLWFAALNGYTDLSEWGVLRQDLSNDNDEMKIEKAANLWTLMALI